MITYDISERYRVELIDTCRAKKCNNCFFGKTLCLEFFREKEFIGNFSSLKSPSDILFVFLKLNFRNTFKSVPGLAAVC